MTLHGEKLGLMFDAGQRSLIKSGYEIPLTLYTHFDIPFFKLTNI